MDLCRALGEVGGPGASPGEDVAEKGIVVCYQRGLKLGLGTGVVLEGRSLGTHLEPRFPVLRYYLGERGLSEVIRIHEI